VKSLPSASHLVQKGYDEVQFKNSPSTQDIMTFMALEASQLQSEDAFRLRNTVRGAVPLLTLTFFPPTAEGTTGKAGASLTYWGPGGKSILDTLKQDAIKTGLAVNTYLVKFPSKDANLVLWNNTEYDEASKDRGSVYISHRMYIRPSSRTPFKLTLANWEERCKKTTFVLDNVDTPIGPPAQWLAKRDEVSFGPAATITEDTNDEENFDVSPSKKTKVA
jgi:hypothetical protein